jgi:hypothetical protein
MVQENVRVLVLETLEQEVLTEENTDRLIELIFSRINLPWYVPGRIVKKVLDRMLPDILLDAIRNLL